MWLNNYSVRVVGGNETAGAYVEMRHGQTYQLQLRNNNNRRCDANVEIDGKNIGTWRLNAHDGLTLERPAHDTGRFTFYKIGTQESRSAQIAENDPNLGLVKVTFTPEVEAHPLVELVKDVAYASAAIPDNTWQDTGTYTIDNMSYTTSAKSFTTPSYRSAGGTGLSGQSGQKFYTVQELEYDYSGQTVIHLRLVCKDDDGVRPLTQYSTPVPPRI